MTNKNLFNTKRVKAAAAPPIADTVNEAGGVAYTVSPRQELAQYIATGTFNNRYYTDAEEQLAWLVPLLDKVASEPQGELFIAQCASYARRKAFMKDTPAFLVAYLGCRGSTFFEAQFELVIDNAKMLRNFVQIIRSGKLGRKSLGSRMKRVCQLWFMKRDARTLLNASVGNQPSIADVIRLVHPRPKPFGMAAYSGRTLGHTRDSTREREGLYGYLVGHARDGAVFPTIVNELEEFRRQVLTGEKIVHVPDVNFDLLTSMPLTPAHWQEIVAHAGHQWLRMNLKTMARHEVFTNIRVADQVAARLASPVEVKKARQFPYQYLTAFRAVEGDHSIPPQVKGALQTAMDHACENIPEFPPGTCICIDLSGSMGDPVTGDRGVGVTSTMTCRDVAALFAAALLKKCPSARVFPFGDDCFGSLDLNPRDSLPTLVKNISEFDLGGTCISSPLRWMNQHSVTSPLVIYLSDNESWKETFDDSKRYGPLFGRVPQATKTMQEWMQFKTRSTAARLVMIDLAPTATTQAPDRSDVLNIGGWSDQMFQTISTFVDGAQAARTHSWIDTISAANFSVDTRR